jgi:Uma2 family endonuclease
MFELSFEGVMSESAKQAASYADLINLPEHLVGEILAGQLHTHPRPAPKHAIAYSALGGNLWNPFQYGKGGPGGWWIIDEPELHLGADILVPDLAGWRRESMPALPETAYFELSPDWVCEILSPATARIDRVIKMPLYSREQVSHLWLVDPDLKTLEVYELREGHWSLQASLKDEDPVRQPPFEACEFSLASLWA